MRRDDFDRELAAFRDGELGWLRRVRVAWRLRLDPAARRRIAALERAAGFLREIDAEGPMPDLWESLRLRLPALDAARAEAAGPVRRGFAPALGWSAAGALTAAAAVAAVWLGLGDGAVPPGPGAHGAVRWLDARGLPMMVLRDDAEATIIWVPDRPPADAASSGRGEVRHGVV